ncbi:unnamed protein product [Linum tenue]|nr:unnamed protein product [Linum tenue]
MPNGDEERDAFKVLDCQNDLVLCGFYDKYPSDEVHIRSYLVCNPFTKQWDALPHAPKKLVYHGRPASRLVCEPPSGAGGAGCRFRVVCLYYELARACVRADVFCSESGEWTKDALVREGCYCSTIKTVVSCDGELFWKYTVYDDDSNASVSFQSVDGFNPFRLDLPPVSVDVSAFSKKPQWTTAVCQDALHLIVRESTPPRPLRLSVWRLEEDRKSWRKQCEGVVNKTSECGGYETEGFHEPFLHPQKPEIVFFNRFAGCYYNNVVLCCDLRREKVEFFAKLEEFHEAYNFLVFHPRVCKRSTPIVFESSRFCDACARAAVIQQQQLHPSKGRNKVEVEVEDSDENEIEGLIFPLRCCRMCA